MKNIIKKKSQKEKEKIDFFMDLQPFKIIKIIVNNKTNKKLRILIQILTIMLLHNKININNKNHNLLQIIIIQYIKIILVITHILAM